MIWQTFYTPEQRRQIYGFCEPLDVSDYVTPYFENSIILEKFKENGDDPYFGVLSHAMRKKTSFAERDINRYLAVKSDVWVLHPNHWDKRGSFMYSVSRRHPHFYELFDWLLKEIGCFYDWKAVNNYKPCVISNFIIARSDIYGDYIEKYLQPAYEAMEAASGTIREKLWADANYKSKNITAEDAAQKFMKHMGIPHYPHHAFLMERLWSVYFFQLSNVQRSQITVWPR